MDQVIQNKIFNAKSEIAEIQKRENKWYGDDFRFNGLRGRIHFGTMIIATITTFIVSLFVADGIGSAFGNALIALVASFMVVGVVLTIVDDSFDDWVHRLDLCEFRKSLIEDSLVARVHEGGIQSLNVWTEFTIERDDVFEKVFVRIVNVGKNEIVETKNFVNA